MTQKADQAPQHSEKGAAQILIVGEKRQDVLQELVRHGKGGTCT